MKFTDGFIGNSAGDDLNNLGHRCQDVEFINLKNYFLVIGDNFNLSFDLSLDKTYPFLLSKKLNMSYYNLSVFNGGMDACKNNAIVWNNRFTKPKFLICNFTFLNSLIHSDTLKIYNSNFTDENIKELYYTGDHNGYFHAKRILLERLLKNYFTCPIYQLQLENPSQLFDSNIIDVIPESHTSHEKITLALFNKIQKQNQKVKP